MFNFLYFYCCVIVGLKTSTCKYIQYLPVFTTVGLSQISTTVRGTLIGGADSDIVDSD